MATYSLVRSHVSTRSRPLPIPSATFRLISGFFIAALTVASSYPASRSPLWATRIPPNQIESRSRSAGSPALPTPMTTRPQLASSPAIAVFTRGEFPIHHASLRPEDFHFSPFTLTSTHLPPPPSPPPHP